MTAPRDAWLAGVDGCRTGWVVAFVHPARGNVSVRIVPRFADVPAAPEEPVVIAVDIPIGLPERAGYGGRAAENAVRPLLGARQSSVFSVPSRAALMAEDYRAACAVAIATSDPPRKVSKQLFMIAPKIREVDVCLRADEPGSGRVSGARTIELPRWPLASLASAACADGAVAARVFEVHPEVAFWRLNGEHALDEPKKVRGRCYEPGLALRRRLLIDAGICAAAVNAAPPKGAGADDLLDALACAAIARRIHAGVAQPFPDPPERDGFGLPMAIWA
jgi:predicted RNase H-like nuclease